MSTAREYIGTHYVESERPVWNEKDMLCLRGQLEKCPSTGRLHWQFYVKFKNAKRPKGAGNACGCEGAHMEPRKFKIKDGDMEDYGLKSETSIEGTQFTFGNVEVGQGTRTDLISIKDDIMKGKSVDEITIEKPHLYHQYGRTLEKIETIRFRDNYRTEMTKGIWYYGGTGVGKSQTAFKDFDAMRCFVWNLNEKFQDGYKQQETVIIDEFRGQIKFSELLTMVDIHPNCFVNLKGKERIPFNSKKVIITSSMHPKDIYIHVCDDKDSLAQLERRFEIVELKK